MTRWTVPLVLTRGLLVGLCVCWPSYTSAEGTERDLSQGQTQTGDLAADTFRLVAETFRLAAEQGDADAQYNLGIAYFEGLGVPQDYVAAYMWFSLAAAQSSEAAKNRDLAATLMTAEQVAEAQFNLGRMYTNGRGVPESGAEALRWYRLAADQGFALAQYVLGVMYTNGVGVPQDYVAAHMWLNLAASQSSGDDRETLCRGTRGRCGADDI